MNESFFWGMTMLKFNFSFLEKSIEIRGGTVFSVENAELFSKVVHLFYHYDEESKLKIFDEKQTNLKKTELLVVTDILSFDAQTLPILPIIYKEIEAQINEQCEIKLELEELTERITNIVRTELITHELTVTIDACSVLTLLKCLKLKVMLENSSIFDKLLDIIHVFKCFTSKKLLVFINIAAYLSHEQWIELQKYVSLQQVNVLFLEPRQVTYSKQFILDTDFYLYEKNVP